MWNFLEQGKSGLTFYKKHMSSTKLLLTQREGTRRSQRGEKGICNKSRANGIYFKISPRNDSNFSKERKNPLLVPFFIIFYLLLFIPPGPKRASIFATVFQDALRMNLTLFLMCFYGSMLSVFQVTCKRLWGHGSHVNNSLQT